MGRIDVVVWNSEAQVDADDACRTSTGEMAELHHALGHWQLCDEVVVGVHHDEQKTTQQGNNEGRPSQVL